MKTRVLIGLTVLLAAVALVASAQQKRLNLFIWSEYIDPAVIKTFEKNTGARVVTTLYESNEDMLAKLQAGGTKQYDIIVPSGYIIPVLLKQNLLRPLDAAKIPNLKNLSERFRKVDFDQGNKYTVAYLWGTTGIGYRKDRFKGTPDSWAIMFDKTKQQGPFQLLDDPRVSIGGALKYLGKSYNSTDVNDLRAAINLLTETKARAIGFGGSPDGKNKLLSRQVNAAVIYNGEAVRAMSEDKNIGYFIPKEGSEIWLDNLAIPRESPNTDLAHQFINTILDARIGAQNANYIQYGTPNEAAKRFITPADLNNPAIYPPEATMRKLEYSLDLGSAQRLIDSAWTKIKAR